MWNQAWRERTWLDLDQTWDLIIIGGGITGAGILREAVHAGLNVLLVDRGDFASGTSSRSSKLVHGGLRYLKNAHLRITLEMVSERERLLRQGRGLINRLGFLYADMKGDRMPGWVFRAGLIIFDLMARKWTHRAYDDIDTRELCPVLTTPQLVGGYRYFDALTDDSRLVFRIIKEAVQAGGTALNYAEVIELLRTSDGQVCGVHLQDNDPQGNERTLELHAGIVINATGAWVDDLRKRIGRQECIRPLRGSHLIFPGDSLPLSRAVSVLHPRDRRPVFAIPWEGVTIFGTTDVDHGQLQRHQPAISGLEVEYLMEAVRFLFPILELGQDDILATFSGIRPVIDTGKEDPSKESREHVIWLEEGMLTVSGGKLTTYRIMARDALKAIRNYLPPHKRFDPDRPVLNPLMFDTIPRAEGLSPTNRTRLWGRYGLSAPDLLFNAQDDELDEIESTPYLWAELRWAAQAEAIVHLDDLLLRRIRLGLLLPSGGRSMLERIRTIVQPELGWDDDRWTHETARYTDLWDGCYRQNHT